MQGDHNATYRSPTMPELDPMARVLAQSFAEDPLAANILPNGKMRVETVAKFNDQFNNIL